MRAMLLGGSSRLTMLFRLFGAGRSNAVRLAAAFGSMGRGIGSAGRLAVRLSSALGGQLFSGLRLAGQAVLWLGRALLMNPIGLLITGIAIGAYLIYRHWDKVKPWFQGLWAGVKAAFAGGIGGVAKLILNWSPLGLFYKAFAGVMKWFGVSLPKNFTDFGGMLIGGLLNGIKAKIGAAKDAIVGFGQDVKGWFANTLGIKSPSRVFMGFGDNIAQGAAIGIGRSSGLASKAAAGMASQTAAAAAVKRLGAAPATRGGGAAAGGAGGMNGVIIHFSPTIQVQGGAAEGVKGQINEALKLSLHELEQLIKRVTAQQARRAY
ncbi:hypothetical protein [Chromobacterium haemolyticum]|uniref:hypothetical protein n=1 Tax=Chromobacterium haemolyticum TaxID=394935 RepID=UPI0011B1CD57|nr:hypothetical protein [Chromobacterium haemolyticum]